MANKKQIDAAREIFISRPGIHQLYMNPKGEFFTLKDYAENSIAQGQKIETITRRGVLKDEPLKEPQEDE